MTLPTPYLLSVRRWQAGGTPNPHGYSEPSYSEPEGLPVHAIAPGPSEEAVASGRDTSSTAWTVYAPAGTSITSKDLVTFNGTEYQVDGDALDFTSPPWANPIAGVTFALTHKEG